MNEISKLLWLDCCGGLFVGCVVLAAHSFFAELGNLPVAVILTTGIANLAYGCFSLSIAMRTSRPLVFIAILALANIAWAPVCFTMTAICWSEISAFGILHLIGEGLFVGALGLVEWRFRHQLAT